VAESIVGHPVEGADAVVLGVPWDKDASFGRGAAGGPQAILECLHSQIELYERFSGTEPARRFKIGHELLKGVSDLAPGEMIAAVTARVAALDALVVVLGGTHTVSLGAIQAVARRLDPATVTVVQLDAHLDLRDDDSDYNDDSPSPLAHSCVMRRAHELGFRTCALGIRAFAKVEHAYASRHKMPVFEWGRGPEPSHDAILAAIPTNRVYLTIDVDGFDPAVMPATGTPVPGGISWAWGSALVRRICSEMEVIGADIVEVAPDGISGLTEYAAAQLCYELVGHTLLRARGSRGIPQTG
jgi:agmatinase